MRFFKGRIVTSLPHRPSFGFLCNLSSTTNQERFLDKPIKGLVGGYMVPWTAVISMWSKWLLPISWQRYINSWGNNKTFEQSIITVWDKKNCQKKTALGNHIHGLCSFLNSVIIISKNINKFVRTTIITMRIQKLLFFVLRVNTNIMKCACCRNQCW